MIMLIPRTKNSGHHCSCGIKSKTLRILAILCERRNICAIVIQHTIHCHSIQIHRQFCASGVYTRCWHFNWMLVIKYSTRISCRFYMVLKCFCCIFAAESKILGNFRPSLAHMTTLWKISSQICGITLMHFVRKTPRRSTKQLNCNYFVRKQEERDVTNAQTTFN